MLDRAQAGTLLLLGLLSASIPLVALARRAKISYPIALVLGGLAMGFVPGLPPISLDPDLVLVIFLPPLLYWESITAPSDVMRANEGPIWFLAIGLVLATTVIVAAVAHWAIPNLSWAMAFVLGAIVAPTDELASAPVLDRMRMPSRLTAIIEGESLLNDASSLILYAAAIGAVVTGVFDLWRTIGQFFIAGFGGVALGVAVGWLAVAGWRRIKDTDLQSVISFAVPFLSYATAQRLGLSGVLAVVYTGIYANRWTPIVITSPTRLQVSGFWNTLVFVANAVLFLLVGLQLHRVVAQVQSEYSAGAVLWYAFVVNVTIVATRLIWCLLQEYAPLPGRGRGPTPYEPNWRHAIVTAWSGLRGAVSLAAALAIPLTVAGGARLVHRDLVIFLTFSVILVTLVGGGLTLPLVIRALRIPAAADDEADLKAGRAAMNRAAIARIDELERSGALDHDDARTMHAFYQGGLSASDDDPRRVVRTKAKRDVLDAQLAALVEMRKRGRIDNRTLRHLQRWLDVEQAALPHIAAEDDA
jgi:CPA1 family monovalent cation:H+ antiporter